MFLSPTLTFIFITTREAKCESRILILLGLWKLRESSPVLNPRLQPSLLLFSPPVPSHTMRCLLCTAMDTPAHISKFHPTTLPAPHKQLHLGHPSGLGVCTILVGGSTLEEGEEASTGPGNGLGATGAGDFGVLVSKMWSGRRNTGQVLLAHRSPLPSGRSKAGEGVEWGALLPRSRAILIVLINCINRFPDSHPCL